MWSWVGEGISPRGQLPLLTWVYIVDVTLWPLGLVIAASAVERPALVLLAPSPTALLALFARQRRQRLDRTLALSTAYRGTTLLLGDVVEADDAYTGTHSRDVVDASLAVADALGLDPTQGRTWSSARCCTTSGKIRVPKEILNKPVALDPAEAQIMRPHTIDGETMLKQVGGTRSSVGRIVRATHERYDRRGLARRRCGRGEPGRVSDHLRLRRVQRDDDRWPVSGRPVRFRGGRRAEGLRRVAIRSRRRGDGVDRHDATPRLACRGTGVPSGNPVCVTFHAPYLLRSVATSQTCSAGAGISSDCVTVGIVRLRSSSGFRAQLAIWARPSLITTAASADVVSYANAPGPASQIRVVIVCPGSTGFANRTASRRSRVGSSGQPCWIKATEVNAIVQRP